MDICPCGSNRDYAQCCEPLIKGASKARTAEELMRSRYSAYVKVATDYLFETTHPAHREGYDHKGTEEWARSSVWDKLDILDTKGGGPEDTEGEVEFIAVYREKGARKQHHELAGFKKEEWTWFFTDGSAVAPRPIVSNKIGRNDPCPCGSGAKYKKCCGK